MYVNWVRSLSCCVTWSDAPSDPHHIISHGVGGMGTKASDLFLMPLAHPVHQELHQDPKAWEHRHGCQWDKVAHTINLAISEGVIDRELAEMEMRSQIKNEYDLMFMLGALDVNA